ncbi:MAG: hypothetical protein JSR32_04180 [Proteobacteria bacterium]|nr:hypothetical protein [Pseudomonadota bacterium]
MELRLFTDLIDVLGKVAGGLKAIINLPKTERETIRRTLDETYRLIDTTFNMVTIQLGDIQLHAVDDDFLLEFTRLDNYNEWVQAEREFRLCRSLRGAMSAKGWNALQQQMQTILATEGEVALFISQQFQQLANDARSATQDNQLTPPIRDALTAFRAMLITEWQELIKQEFVSTTLCSNCN